MQEEKDIQNTEKKISRRFVLFLIIFLLLLLGIITYIFRNTLYSSLKKVGFLSGSDNNVVIEDNGENSVFNQLVSQENNNNYVSIYTPEVRTNLDLAFSFEAKYRELGDGDWGTLIEENQVVLEVHKDSGGSTSYTFVDSKNPDFQFDKGSNVDITPVVKTPESLVVRQGDDINFRFQEGDFNDLEKDIFRKGDKIIFICNLSSCEDGILNWLLVFRN